jgi:putative hydrolase of the HAD superfamily
MTSARPATIRAVLFDAVGTILRPEPSVAAAYAEVGRRFGCHANPAEIAARFARAFREQERLDRERSTWQTDEARERERWRAIVATVLPECGPSREPFELLWQHFGHPAQWRLDPAFDRLRGRLVERGIAVGVASNFDARLHAVGRGFPGLDGCPIFVSTEIGWRKPALEFFRAIERRLHLVPREIMLVGDDLVNDYEAARRAGWQSVLLDAERPAGWNAIANLEELSERF